MTDRRLALKPFRYLGIVATIVCLVAVAHYSYKTLTNSTIDVSSLFSSKTWAICILIYSLQYLFLAEIFRSILSDTKISLSFIDSLKLLGTSQIAKYTPGNVGHHIGRLFLAEKCEVPKEATIYATLVETVQATLIGTTLVVLSGLYFGIQTIPWHIALIILLFGLPSIKFLLPRLYSWLLGFALKNNPKISLKTSTKRTLKQLLLQTLSFLNLGAIMWLLAKVWSHGAELNLSFCIFVASASWVSGFLTPGSPSGIGVREGISIMLLSKVTDANTATLLTLSHRLTTLVGDGVVFGISWALWLPPKKNKK